MAWKSVMLEDGTIIEEKVTGPAGAVMISNDTLYDFEKGGLMQVLNDIVTFPSGGRFIIVKREADAVWVKKEG